MLDTHLILVILGTIAVTLAGVAGIAKLGWLGAAETAIHSLEIRTEAEALHIIARGVTFLTSTSDLDAKIADLTSQRAARVQMGQQALALVQSAAKPAAPSAT